MCLLVVINFTLMMNLRPNSLLFIILLSTIHGFLFVHALPEEHLGTMRLELIHRYSPQFNGNDGMHGMTKRPKTQLELIKQLHQHDLVRHRMMSHKRLHNHQHHHQQGLGTRRKDWETPSIAMPMNSGWDYGFGQYLVQVKVGTPAQKFMLIADTGSDLTWINCRYGCGRKCDTHKGRLNNKRVFHADRSSTFKTVPCSSQLCKIEFANLFSLTSCPTPLTPCSYDYRYLEGSGAMGVFANETVSAALTNGRKTKLYNVVIGCTRSIQGNGGITGGDGILGLGFGKYSFTSKAAQTFGGKFSYCLVDHSSPKNVSNYLKFGANNDAALLNRMRYTKLVLGGSIGSLYGVNVLSISIGETLLKIPSEVWDANLGGGTIVDSGTSLTYLTLPAYQPVMAALTTALSKYERITTNGDPFEFCFNATEFDESLVPRLVIHLADGARFEPPVKSYIIDVAFQKKCLAFVAASLPGPSIIGNIMQQNHLWEFDFVRSTLGFAPSKCT